MRSLRNFAARWGCASEPVPMDRADARTFGKAAIFLITLLIVALASGAAVRLFLWAAGF